MQKAIFPILKTWETQPMNSGSHKDTKAIDFGVLNPYKDTKLTAPFDGKIVYVDKQSNGGGIAFESLEKVKYADGTEDYMTLWTGHDNKPPKLGSTFKQGEHYSDMGTAGGVNMHCHLEVIKGKFKMATKVTSKGSYKFENTIEPYKALFLNKDGLIKYSNYKWTTLPDIEITNPVERNESVNQIRVIVDNLRVRTGHSTNNQAIGFVQNNGIYNDLEAYSDGTYTWHRIDENQWIADDGSWLEILPATDYKKLYEDSLQTIEELNYEILQATDYKKLYEDSLQTIEELNYELLQKTNTINDLKNKMQQINELSK